MGDTKKEEFAIDLIDQESLEEMHHVNNPVLDLPKIEKKYLRPVSGYVKEANSYIFTDGKARVEVKVVTDEIIRIRLAPKGVFLEDFSYAVVAIEEHASAHHVAEDEMSYHVITAAVTCSIRKKDFLVSFGDREGKIVNADYAPMH